MQHPSLFPRPARRRLSLVISASLALTPLSPAIAIAQSAPAAATAQQRYAIPGGPLGAALTRFAAESGVYLAAAGELTAGKQSPGVSGRYSREQALQALLAGSGVAGRIEADRISLYPAPATPSAPAAGMASAAPATLDTLQVRGTYLARNSTATGLNLDLRETPQSVSVITSAMMEDRQINNLADIVEHTTGLSISRYESNRGSMFSRGFKIESYLIDGVPTTIDEQWSAGEILSNTAIYDHAEVLRGSDGLMVGTGSPSAVINLIRKKADSREFAGNVAVEYGSWANRGLTVDLSTPLSTSGNTRLRVAGDYQQGDSHIHRLSNRSHVLYATLEQDIGDDTLVSAGFSTQDNHTHNPSWGGTPAWMVDADGKPVAITGLRRSLNTRPTATHWMMRWCRMPAWCWTSTGRSRLTPATPACSSRRTTVMQAIGCSRPSRATPTSLA